MPEAYMIVGMSWRVQNRHHFVTGAKTIAVAERRPALVAGFRPLAGVEIRPARAQRRHAAGVIAVSVRHEHARERPAAERLRDRVDVFRRADARVDERRLGAVEEPGVVAGARQRSGIRGGDELSGSKEDGRVAQTESLAP